MRYEDDDILPLIQFALDHVSAIPSKDAADKECIQKLKTAIRKRKMEILAVGSEDAKRSSELR